MLLWTEFEARDGNLKIFHLCMKFDTPTNYHEWIWNLSIPQFGLCQFHIIPLTVHTSKQKRLWQENAEEIILFILEYFTPFFQVPFP